MAEIKVRSGELMAKADYLEGLNRDFRNEVANMVSYESELANSYTGESQQAFRNAFNTDKQKMDLFAENIDKYVLALREDAQVYETAENKATEIAATRKA